MMKKPQVQRLMFLFAVSALVAATANYACLSEVCADLKTAEFRTMGDIEARRVERLDEALKRLGTSLNADQRTTLKATGELTGVSFDRPVKMPSGKVVSPSGWLPEIPDGHPWREQLTPSDDAFYSFFEERILQPRLYDPENPQHVEWARAYIAKSQSNSPEFIGWTYANRTECAKIQYDAKGTKPPVDAR